MAETVKLNIGCGTDYREGYINIDGSKTLEKVDLVIDIANTSLLTEIAEGSVDFILANDIIEHNFHWEAVNIINDFNRLLKPGGQCEIRVPDCEFIINNPHLSIEQKLLSLYGGQDIPQGNDEMNISRQKYPQYFCHKFGWTRESMTECLNSAGFAVDSIDALHLDFIIKATKQ